MATTIKEIARLAHVSPATVSHIITGRAKNVRISERTRTKVQKIIRETGYVPNIYASTLRGGKTFTIGMVITNILRPAMALIHEGVKDAAKQKGYHVIVGVSSDEVEDEAFYIKNLLSRRVDGIIVIPAPSGETLPKLRQLYNSGFPIVLCEIPGVMGIDAVMADVEEGAYLATNHLIKLGHQKIAFCSGHSSWCSARTKYQGYRRALEDKDMVVRPEYHVKVEGSSYSDGEKAAQLILQLTEHPEGVVFHNDEMAAGAMNCFINAGWKIPENISLVGFDDLPISKMVQVPLTTISSPVYEVGQTALKLLLERAESKDKEDTEKLSNMHPQSIRFPPKLIVRQSCRQC